MKNKKSIPFYYQKMMDDKFLKDFKEEFCLLFDIKENELNLFDVQNEENTNGWATAFYATCLLNCASGLGEYYESLDWEKSDDFCREVTHMMNKRGIIE